MGLHDELLDADCRGLLLEVGEYADEFTPHRYRYVKKLSGSQYIIDAGIRVSELEPLVDFPFPSGDYVTLGGLVYHTLGRIPTVGEVVELDGGRLKVLEMDKHRITKVLFQDTALDETTGAVRLADELSPAESDDIVADSEPPSAEYWEESGSGEESPLHEGKSTDTQAESPHASSTPATAPKTNGENQPVESEPKLAM